MSNAVIPRQQGDTYQARFFWLNASKLFHPKSCVTKIEWESDSSIGFDDVVLHYSPPKLDDGDDILIEKYQVKFHVDQNRGFTCQSLIDPGFIGTTSETILGRLYKLYLADPDSSRNARYYMVNTWGIDHSDEFGHLMGNGGAIRLTKLFDGTGDGSVHGKIRKSWRDYLGITDDYVLKEILRPLRILHSYADLTGIVDPLNTSLQLAGLKPIAPDQRTSGHTELIQQLHAEGKRAFTRDELLDICKREGLVTGMEAQSKNEHVIGVRSFSKGAENLALEVNELLCLLHFFSGRFIHEEVSWQSVYPMLAAFADRALATKKPLLVYLDTHLSVAFCLGYCMDIKYGANISVIQKTMRGALRWTPQPEHMPAASAGNWSFDETIIDDAQADTVVAVSVTHLVGPEVVAFAAKEIPAASKIIHATIKPHPANTSIRDANHIIVAVQELVGTIKGTLVRSGRRGTVHILMAAPNAFAFFLGQQSRMLGKIILYEYDFENRKSGSYLPVITLPVM